MYSSFTTKILLSLARLASIVFGRTTVQLNGNTFHGFIGGQELVLVNFILPGCHFCVDFAPVYEEIAESLQKHQVPAVVVDCQEEKDLCHQLEIPDFPTLQLFQGPNSTSTYQGQRAVTDVVTFVTRRIDPLVKHLSQDDLADFKSSNNISLVAYVVKDDPDFSSTYSSVAASFIDDYPFAIVNDATDGDTRPSIVCYKNFDEGEDRFDGPFTQHSIEDFIRATVVPVIGEINESNFPTYMTAGLPVAYIFTDTTETLSQLSQTLRPVAELYRKKISFVLVDARQFGSAASKLNLPENVWPAMAVEDLTTGKIYTFADQDLSLDRVNHFAADFMAGNLKPSVKSEPVPEEQIGPVTNIVAHTFQELVLDSPKDVLVNFYSPNCPHCKKLAPTFQELATLHASAKSTDKIMIAQINAAANQVPGEITGYPTLQLYPADSKDSPIRFKGNRTLEDLAQFVRDNGKFRIDVLATISPGSDALDGAEHIFLHHQVVDHTEL